MAEIFDFHVNDNRSITFKLSEPIMLEDNGVSDWRFHIPNTVNGLDATGWQWWLVYVNAKNEKYTIPLTLEYDYDRPDAYSIATYTVDYGMSCKVGNIKFSLEAIDADTGGTILHEWHTKTYTTNVVDTLQGNQVEYAETESDIISALLIEVRNRVNQLVGGATPTPVSSVSEMLDTNKLYLLTTNGEWYYYNGTTWVSGGVYGAGVVDSVPTQGSANAVSSGGVYDALVDKADKDSTPTAASVEESEADLYVCDENGNVIAEFADGHIRTKNFDSGNIESLIKEASHTEADLYICDSFGNVVGEFINGHIRTKNFNSADMDGIPEDVSTIQTDVSALQTATSGILYRVKDQTDGVYASCRWHQPNSSAKQFCLLMGGDVHADASRMNSMVDLLNGIGAFDAGIMLGDISGNTYDNSIQFYMDALDNATKPFLTVLGNHDVGGATSDADLWTKYGDCIQYADLAEGEAVEGKCYYYKDFPAYKIRVIVLMQYDYKFNGNLCFGQDQIDWLIGVLNSTPSDYGVIICEHTNPSRYMDYNMDATYTSDTWKQSNYAPTVMSGDPVPDIVNAWIAGTTLSQTYSYTYENPPADLVVSADFTSRGTGEFITYLGGHWHMDVVGSPTGYTNQMDYHLPATGLNAAVQGDIPRRSGTASEDSLCVLGVDRDKKTVKIFHVGAHYTKDAVDRQYFQYVYGGSST